MVNYAIDYDSTGLEYKITIGEKKIILWRAETNLFVEIECRSEGSVGFGSVWSGVGGGVSTFDSSRSMKRRRRDAIEAKSTLYRVKLRTGGVG